MVTKNSKYAVLIIFLFIFNSYFFAEINLNKFKHFSSTEGLDAVRVVSLIQDNEGFILIGTANGLIRYDGYRFEEIKSGDNRKETLFTIDELFELKNNTILIKTEFEGIYLLDLKDYSIKKENLIKGFNFVDNNITKKVKDINNNIWSGFDNYSLVKLNNLLKQPMNFNNGSLHYRIGNNIITALLVDSNGSVWIGTSNGLNRFNKNLKKVVEYKNSIKEGSISNNYIQYLFEDSHSNIWIGTKNGLNLFNENSNKFDKFKEEKSNMNAISNNWVSTICEDIKGNLWIGTRGGGINVMNPSNRSFVNYRNNIIIKDTLGENVHILSLLKDKSGIIWIGTHSKGLYNFDYNTNQFGYYKKKSNNRLMGNVKNVWSITEDKTGNIWMGTLNGLKKFNRSTGELEVFLIDNNVKTKSLSNAIISVLFSKNEKIWAASLHGGLKMFDPIQKKFIKYDWIHNSSNKEVRVIFEDSYGLIWIGTVGRGIIKFDPKRQKTEYYLNKFKKSERLLKGTVVTFFEDKTNRLWFGTMGDGLKYFDKDGHIKGFQTIPKNMTSISNNYILSINGDDENNIFIGTKGGGLNIFNSKKNTFKHFGIKDGLPSNIIYGLLIEKKKNLWLSTTKGLSKFSLKDHTFQNYNFKDGLLNNEFNIGTYHKDSNGRFYFGGNKGIDYFDPKEITSNSFIPNIVITKLRKFGSKNDTDQDFFTGNSITLNYNDSFFLEFSALNFTNPGKNKYAYKIEGLHKRWIQLGTNRSITFNNLNPGENELKIIGSNNDGVWNKKGRVIKLIINPPLWGTLWFKIIIFILILMLIFIWQKKREEKLLKRLTTETVIENFLNKYGISSREKEIIKLVVDGKSNKEIENELYITYGTVKNHVHNIYQKLNIKNRAQLISLIKSF